LKAPPLYKVRKFAFRDIVNNDFNLNLTEEDNERFIVKQQDNMLFRQIRLITGDYGSYIDKFVFVSCKGWKSKEDKMDRLILDGFYINGEHFVCSERSSSMTRNNILSFVRSDISEQLNERVSMGLDFGKCVLSKLYAYKGLMLSSCHCLDNWYPKIIIVPDYYRVIPNQRIKCLYDKIIEFIDKNGNKRNWTQKDIKEDVRDITINAFDGCGIHHPAISKIAKELIQSKTDLTSILWRAPFIKGVTHEIDYERFLRERGISKIVDVWGVEHDISEPMIIMTESMYKGKKYFKEFGDYRDWDKYWRLFRKYNHCLGIAKYNFSKEEEHIYTRINYQILQDLDLPYDEFELLAKDSVEWAEKIINGDTVYTYCFLGLLADDINPENNYTKSIVKNPMMLKEKGVRNYLVSLLKKKLDEMKCGKLWIESCFRFLTPDLIMLTEWIGGNKNPDGCLNSDEFWTSNKNGTYFGDFLIERNPHICRSEHVKLKAVTNELIEKYCSHLSNVCMVNCKSITPQKLNGADFDGDLVLVVNNSTMMKGIDPHAIPVVDTEDKTTVEEQYDTKENRLKVIKRTMKNMIGEYSNCATTYHNKSPKTPEQKEKYIRYIDIISVLTGKSIDYAKTGVLYKMPKNIAKGSQPLPYFMRYAKDYDVKTKKLSRSYSNMNRLCFALEKWEKSIRWKYSLNGFDYKIMINDEIPHNENTYNQIKQIYKEYNRKINELTSFQYKLRNYDEYADELFDIISKTDSKNFVVDWRYYYNQFKSKCLSVCPDICELANYVVKLSYEEYPKRDTRFMWEMAGEGIVKNIKQVDITLPLKSSDGNYIYLGEKYKLIRIGKDDVVID